MRLEDLADEEGVADVEDPTMVEDDLCSLVAEVVAECTGDIGLGECPVYLWDSVNLEDAAYVEGSCPIEYTLPTLEVEESPVCVGDVEDGE